MSHWLDDLEPHEPDRAEAQLAGLLALLGPARRRVLDLGCGAGRITVPLAEAGHDVVGVDHNPDALHRCAESLERAKATATLLEGDFTRQWPRLDGPVDLVCCLGNTFMLIADVDVAVDVLNRSAMALTPDGMFAMDDCPNDLWPELAQGNWQTGLSDDGSQQLVWAADDALFALRCDDGIDAERWHPGESDTVLRLWTAGSLRLAARCAGLSAFERLGDAGLLVARPRTTPAGLP